MDNIPCLSHYINPIVPHSNEIQGPQGLSVHFNLAQTGRKNCNVKTNDTL